VDAHLEVQSGWAGGRRSDRAKHLPRLDSGAALDRDVEQIPVEAERPRSVIDDHQIPESGKRVRKRADSFVNGPDRRALRHGEFHSVRRGAAYAGGAEPSPNDEVVSRPIQIAA